MWVLAPSLFVAGCWAEQLLGRQRLAVAGADSLPRGGFKGAWRMHASTGQTLLYERRPCCDGVGMTSLCPADDVLLIFYPLANLHRQAYLGSRMSLLVCGS